jgi:hypothetical protein
VPGGQEIAALRFLGVRLLLREGDPGCRSENRIELRDGCIRVGLRLKFDLSVLVGMILIGVVDQNYRPFSVHQSTHGHLLLLKSLIPATPGSLDIFCEGFMHPRTTLRRALEDPALLGNCLPGDSWRSWRTLLIAAHGRGIYHRLAQALDAVFAEAVRGVEQITGAAGQAVEPGHDDGVVRVGCLEEPG